MSYLRSFYPQTEELQARLSYRHSSASEAAFGLSGDSVLSFNILNKVLKVNGVFCSSLDNNSLIEVNVAAKDGSVTVWNNGCPIINPFDSGFSFDSVFCSLPSGSTFTEKTYGKQPTIGHSLSAWDYTIKSGNLILGNSGDSPLYVSDLISKNNFATPVFSPVTISPSSTVSFPLLFNDGIPISGTGNFIINTNAGVYNFNEYFNLRVPTGYNSFSAYFDSDINYPSGLSNFFLINDGTEDLFVNMSLDLESMTPFAIKTGYATYPTPSGIEFIDYSNGGFFKEIAGSGLTILNINEWVTESKTFSTGFVGEITGVGGRLSATGIMNFSGLTDITIYPTGLASFYYRIPVSSVIMGQPATATATGLLTGLVGPGSGYYKFQQDMVVDEYNIDGAVHLVTSNVDIYPSSGDIFTGYVNFIQPLTALVSGNQNHIFYKNMYIYEGSGNFKESWNLKYYDVDRGLEDFSSLGRLTSSGFEGTGVTYRIPSKSITSGYINYFNDYSERIFQKFAFRISDNSSLNESLYINSPGEEP